jgi:hypothetical protein
MDIEKRLAILQTTYAASVAETVNIYDKLQVLEKVVEDRKAMQAQKAPYLNQQLGIESVEDVFAKLSEIYNCANWTVKKTGTRYAATATACKLCSFSKKMGGANACRGWCLDPMIAMLTALCNGQIERISVESTLHHDDCCKIILELSTERP